MSPLALAAQQRQRSDTSVMDRPAPPEMPPDSRGSDALSPVDMLGVLPIGPGALGKLSLLLQGLGHSGDAEAAGWVKGLMSRMTPKEFNALRTRLQASAAQGERGASKAAHSAYWDENPSNPAWLKSEAAQAAMTGNPFARSVLDRVLETERLKMPLDLEWAHRARGNLSGKMPDPVMEEFMMRRALESAGQGRLVD